TWTFVDGCNNTSSVSQTINVSDTIAPVAPQAPATLNVACASEVPAMISLTANDNCNGAITVLGSDSITAGNCPNSFTVTRTWTFVDGCGNTSSVSQTISVNDTVAPTFNQSAPANTSVSCDNIPAPAVLTAIDNCGTATVSVTETILAGNCPSNYQIVRSWTATDTCGNSSAPVTQTITVSDTVGPQIINPITSNIAVTCDAIPDAPILTAANFTDNCSTVGTPVFAQTQTQPDVNGTFQIIRIWTVSDACGNTTAITQSITVTQTTTVTEVLESSCTNENIAYILRDLLDNPDDVPSDAVWTNEDNVGGFTGGNTFNAFGITPGIYTFSYTITTGLCPRRFEIKMTVNTDCGVLPCESIIIHNAFTPNGDGTNEYFDIENIEDLACYPTNNVEIYNRWGVLVYETRQYDNNTRKFIGVSEGRATISKSDELPTGTYFYIIQWTTTDGQTFNKDGYLYLSR
ncbi:gliding motility-associated C-terminal domain-containing protein, partial [Flavobacterium sp.]|uniref:gliding motility-associated C-terminal domain-containing protein n=1 Tax=Flavobacterium sp. TaxID=239 RepID=UPI0037C17736